MKGTNKTAERAAELRTVEWRNLELTNTTRHAGGDTALFERLWFGIVVSLDSDTVPLSTASF